MTGIGLNQFGVDVVSAVVDVGESKKLASKLPA